jgi:hypothetical protein
MRTRILRVVVLLSAFSFPFFARGQKSDGVPSVAANEAGARLALQEKSSVFSIDLSANVSKPISATFGARILAPDDKVLAAASVPVQLSSTPRRFDVPLNWVPVNGLKS